MPAVAAMAGRVILRRAAGPRNGNEAERDQRAAGDEEEDAEQKGHGVLRKKRSRGSAPRAQPFHHDAVEGFGALDIGEMPGIGDLFVATARHQAREAAVL